MLRIKNTFKYNGNYFITGEITVQQYLSWLIEPEKTILEILNEFNEKTPKLSSEHTEKFLEILFQIKDHKNKNNMKDFDFLEEFNDMEYFIVLLAKNLNQPISEILSLPLTSYRRIYSRIGELLDPSKYKRLSKKADRKAINDLKNILKK
ncbi:hypothetical protein GW846_03150 [Candidatus Gracilibacteria bacterium]|nr:hypothetical protein [Candidatus Gracilibacteria bacterium]